MGIEMFQDSSVSSGERDLLTPALFSVTTMLMEDAVLVGDISVGSAQNQLALFSNPFKEGVEEALVINAQGVLTYLQRTNNRPTGWEQTEVSGAPQLAEVVVAEHPDGSLWSFGVPVGDAQPWDTRKLTGKRSPDGTVTCEWSGQKAFDGEPGKSRCHNLNVSYSPDGGAVIVAGGSPNIQTPFLAVYAAFSTGATPFYPWNFTYSSNFNLGPGHVVMGGGFFGAGATETKPRFVAYFGSPLSPGRDPGPISRLEFGGDPDWMMTLTEAAYGFCGTWFVPSLPHRWKSSDVGCVYLDTNGNLHNFYRKWEKDIRVDTKIETNFRYGKTWQDADGDLHVFGHAGYDTLQVLHQDGWRAEGNNLHIQWSQATADDGTRTTAIVGLAAQDGSISFTLDPYPDYEPKLLLAEGGSQAQRTVLYVRESTNSRWTEETVRLPSSGDPKIVNRYMAEATLLDNYGAPISGHLVTVTAESLVEVQVNGISFRVGPGRDAEVRTNMAGRLTVSVPAHGLVAPVVFLNADGLAQAVVVDLDAPVNAYLAGKDKIPSQAGLLSSTALTNARCYAPSGLITPLVADWSKAKYQQEAVVALCQTMYNMAAGDQQLPKFAFDGDDDPQEIVGYAIQVWDPSQPMLHAFRTSEELEHYRASRHALPAYGGLWDGFTTWAADVWEGIRTGATKVVDLTVSQDIEIKVEMNGKVVSLGRWAITDGEQASQAVEALFALVSGEAAVRVVDWLKTRFPFSDIWNTKSALEVGYQELTGLVDVALKRQYYSVDPGWFRRQQEVADVALGNMKDAYARLRMADFQNRIPPISDISGGTVDPRELSSPQANWLLDRILDWDGTATIDGCDKLPIMSELGTLSVITRRPEFRLLIDSLAGKNDFLKSFFAVNSVQSTSGSRYSELIDEGIAPLMPKILAAADEAYHDLFEIAATTLIPSLKDLLTLPMKLGPINDLYRWIGTRATGRPPDPMTVGGFAALVTGFQITCTHKMILGINSRPFPDGFPAIPPYLTPAAHVTKTKGAADYNMQLVEAQSEATIIAVAHQALTALTDFVTPLIGTSYSKNGLLPVNLAAGFMESYATLLAAPPVWGRPWSKADGLAFVLEGTRWAADCVFACIAGLDIIAPVLGGNSALLKNLPIRPITPGGILEGSGLQLLLGAGDLISREIAATQRHLENENLQDLAYLAASIRPLRDIIQAFRNAGSADGNLPYQKVIANTDGALASLGDLCAGNPGVLELGNVPNIETKTPLPNGTAGMDYGVLLTALGGSTEVNFPLREWRVSAGALPAGLRLDPSTGLISGRIQAPPGDYALTVQVRDSFAPPLYTAKAFTLHVQGTSPGRGRRS
ncbi:Ig domain-containing protein [Streptomyces sp. NPDC048419]|uniref:Ig domain-containing protein n=1 Tax=Streptomyces sp. NPDC048419 TaxID=3365547 RepID=UPI003716CD71